MLTVQLGKVIFLIQIRNLISIRNLLDAPNSPVCLANRKLSPVIGDVLSTLERRRHNARHADRVGGGDDDIGDPR